MTFASQLATAFTPIAAVYDAPSTAQALSWAQSFVESYCNRIFDQTDSVVYVDPKPGGTALLPFVPVISVTSVQALLPQPGGLTWVTLTNYEVVNETGLIYNTTGLSGYSWSTGPSWPWLSGSLQVEYVYGFPTVPQSLIDTSCRLAQQYLENPTLQLQRRVGDIEDRYAGSAGMVLNDLDKRILDRFTDVDVA